MKAGRKWLRPALLCLFSLMVGLVAPVGSAVADEKEELTPELQEIVDVYLQNGVDESVALNVAERIGAGELVDAVQMSTYQAVEVGTSVGADGTESTTYHYPDGSIEVLSLVPLANAPGQMQPMSISGCITSGTPGAQSGCQVSYWSANIQMRFSATYALIWDSYDAIYSVYDNYCSGLGGTTSLVSFGILKNVENGYGPASADLKVQWNGYGGVGSVTKSLRLYVGGNSAWDAIINA